jgi:hypothetical protein
MAFMFIILLIIPNISTMGLSSWKETAADFPSGQNQNTCVENGSLALAINDSMATNWTKMGDTESPPPRYRHSMVYDPADGVHIVFSG